MILLGSDIPTYTLYELHHREMKEKTILPIRVTEKIILSLRMMTSRLKSAVETGNWRDRYSREHKPLGIS